MALANYIYPDANVLVAKSVTVDLSSVAVQNLLEVPRGLRLVVTNVILRDPSATVTPTVALGFATTAAGATQTLRTAAAALAMTGGAQASQELSAQAQVPVVKPTGKGGEFLNLTISSGNVAGVAKVDVLGYLISI